MKKSWLALALAGVAFSPAVLAASTQSNTSNSSTQEEIAALKKRIEALESNDISTTRSLDVGTQKVFGIGSDEYNNVLYINDFGLNTDLNLLHQRRFVHAYFRGFDNAPRLMFSGNAFGTAGIHSHVLPVDSSQGKQFMQAGVELDVVGYANEDWLAYFEMQADAFGDDTDFGIQQGFVTYGNLDKMPTYITLGYQYIPFGAFTTAFITNTLVQDLARTQTPAVTGGYVYTKEQMNLNTSAFWYDGSEAHTSSQNRLNQWGINAQFRNEKLTASKDLAFTVGASFENNLAASNQIGPNVVDSQLKHLVPAIDLRFQLDKGNFTFLSEYVQALQGFSEEDFTQTVAGHSAQHIVPEATHFEMAYKFPVWALDTQLSIAYDQTQDSLAFELPEEQYGASYQLIPYSNTYVTFEYMHKINYGANVSTTAGGVAQNTGTGETDDMFQVQVNVFF